MAPQRSGAEVTAEQINELYWSDAGTVEEIVTRLGISRSTLYGSIEPEPSGLRCAHCHAEMVFANRTARDRGVAVCPECGRESEPGEAPAGSAGNGLTARPGDGRTPVEADARQPSPPRLWRRIPPQRAATVIGGAALGIVAGALMAGAVSSRR